MEYLNKSTSINITQITATFMKKISVMNPFNHSQKVKRIKHVCSLPYADDIRLIIVMNGLLPDGFNYRPGV